jgi:SAM-dependent methyltransferase
MIGELYESALAGLDIVQIEYAGGMRRELPTQEWLALRPGDTTLLDRCAGPTLDVGSGPGRLTVALAERGMPALGIDITPYAVAMTRAAGGLALQRDVFGPVPGAGRWETVLLADGNIGIGGDPVSLLRRARRLLARGGRIVVEVEAPGVPSRTEDVRLRTAGARSDWFRWAHVSVDDIAELAARSAAQVIEGWEVSGRWFCTLRT